LDARAWRNGKRCIDRIENIAIGWISAT